jgi:hypothetical protein
LLNAALHSATLLIWFFGLLRIYGIRIALVATVLLGIFPEFWFTTTLATTDNVVVLFIVLFMLLLPRLGASKPVGAIFGIAAILFFANVLRTIGPLMALGMMLWACVESGQNRRWHVALNVVGVIFIYVLLGTCLALFVPHGIADPLQLIKALSSIDFHSTQDFASNYPWGEYFWFSMPESVRMKVALVRVLREFIYGFEFLPTYLFGKIATLFSGTGYYGLSSFDFAAFNPDTFFNVPKSTIPFHAEWFPYFSAISFLYAGLALKSVISASPREGQLVSIAWIVAFCLLVLCLGETQGRYVVLIAPALSLLASLALVSERFDSSAQQERKIVSYRAACGLGLLFALYGVLLVVFAVAKKVDDPLALSVRLDDKSVLSDGCRDAKVVTTYKNVRVTMPPGTRCAVLLLPLRNEVKELSFFVSAAVFPYLWEPKKFSDLAYSVVSDSTKLYQTDLGLAPVRWQKINLLPGGNEKTHDVRFVLSRTAASVEETYDVSWILP